MKSIVLSLMLLTSLAHANEVNDLSKRMADAFETELKDLPAKKYNMSFMGQFTYKMNPEGPTATLPVFLFALSPKEWNSDFTSCEVNSHSAVCEMAEYSLNWYQQMGPAVNGKLGIKAIIFEGCEDKIPCPLVRTGTISVTLKN